MDSQCVSRTLRQLIDTHDTNVPGVSKATGIPATTLYTLLGKKTNQVDLGILEKLANHFDVRIDFFCGPEKYKEDIHLNEEEEKIIMTLRSMNSKGQRRLFEYAMELKEIARYSAETKVDKR